MHHSAVSIGNLGAEVTSRAGRDAVATAANATSRVAMDVNMVLLNTCVRNMKQLIEQWCCPADANSHTHGSRLSRCRLPLERCKEAAATRVVGQAEERGSSQRGVRVQHTRQLLAPLPAEFLTHDPAQRILPSETTRPKCWSLCRATVMLKGRTPSPAVPVSTLLTFGRPKGYISFFLSAVT